MKLIPTIGLEIHAELKTESKIFCSCSAHFGGEPNSRCCPGCSGFPGTLPSMNKKAVEYSIMAGFATNCGINRFTSWERKNYFYPDLPKAYQVSQLPYPICVNGHITIDTSEGEKTIRINRIHLEEDAGKLTHDDSGKVSLADYNRGCIPLIELVTEPDIHSAEEAAAFLEKIRLIYQYAGVCDGKMEQGALRCDVNISLAPEGSKKLGVRAEIKNLNSVRSITRAIEYEIYRQSEAIMNDVPLYQETRRFSDATGETSAMRTKENAQDYRYFPDPDIPPLLLTEEELEEIKSRVPVMPEKRFEKYVSEYGVSKGDAEILISAKVLSDFFEKAVAAYDNPKVIASFIVVELLHRVNSGEADLENLPFSESALAKLVEFGQTGKVSKSLLKDVLREMLETGEEPEKICEKNGLLIKEDLSLVESTIDELLRSNEKAAAQYRAGETKVFAFLMGQASKALKGAAAPAVIKEMLEKKLK